VITKAKQAAAKTDKKDALHLRRLALSDVRDETALTLLFKREAQGVHQPQRRLHPHLPSSARSASAMPRSSR